MSVLAYLIMINSKYKLGLANDLLDLSKPQMTFFIDHLFKIPQTTKSLVFFPYDIVPEQIEMLNKHCNENDYKIIFSGGESVYGGKGPFTNGTMTIMLIHKDDDHPRIELLSKLELLKIIED
jgi:hypothetical protein